MIDPFCLEFGDRAIGQVTPDEILSFLNRLTDGNRPYTKRVRYSQLSCFFSFIRHNIDSESANPCDTPMIRKLYRQKVKTRWEIIEKETIDEIIFRTTKNRNRLLLELMARGGMRVGDVLKLRMKDLKDQKLILIKAGGAVSYFFLLFALVLLFPPKIRSGHFDRRSAAGLDRH